MGESYKVVNKKKMVHFYKTISKRDVLRNFYQSYIEEKGKVVDAKLLTTLGAFECGTNVSLAGQVLQMMIDLGKVTVSDNSKSISQTPTATQGSQ